MREVDVIYGVYPALDSVVSHVYDKFETPCQSGPRVGGDISCCQIKEDYILWLDLLTNVGRN